jgi:hypothetical protein
VDIPPGARDLQLLGGGRVLVSYGDGAGEHDLATGQPLLWRIRGLKGCQTARRLADGTTLLGCNTDKGVAVYRADASGASVEHLWDLPEAKDLRLMRRLANGNLLFTLSGPYRVVELSAAGQIVWQASLEGKGYKAIRLENGNVMATTGGTCTVTEIDADGEVVRRVGGKEAHPHADLDWFSGFDVLTNGHVVAANWLGHGKHGTGPHLVEFSRENELIWEWEDHEAARQITNLLVLDELPDSLFDVTAAGRWCTPPTRLAVQAKPAARMGIMKDRGRIHTNRHYRYEEVPDALLGLSYSLGEHKRPPELRCRAETAGVAFLALGEGGEPIADDFGTIWVPCGHMKGTDSSAPRDWVIYRTRLEAGQEFTVKPPNKWGATLIAGALSLPDSRPVEAVSEREYQYLRQLLSKRPDAARRKRLLTEAANRQACIWDEDRDPLDVALRRVEALAAYLGARPGADSVADLTEALASLRKCADAVDPAKDAERKALFVELCALRRDLALRNPLLTFRDIAFLTHHPARRNHMCDQYFGFNANPGGTLYILRDAFSESPTAEPVLADAPVSNGRLAGKPLENGSFISLELSYDARTFYFAWTEGEPDIATWRPETTYHVFAVQSDGTHLRQLTDGPWNEFDPCCLPDGRIAFISERRGGYGRCHGRPVPTYTLHAMDPDGSGIHPLSLHETNEWHPSVDTDGMLVYSRWDYVDRDSDVAHHLWLCFPDGRDPRSYHGNYPVDRHSRPWMELSLRAVPGVGTYLGVAAPHHGQAYGSLISIDLRPEDDNSMSQIRRVTPETPFPEAERGPVLYGSPWPLDETTFLTVFDWSGRHYGIYLADVFGNRILLYEDADAPCLDPTPLVARPPPPVIPGMANQEWGRPDADAADARGVGRVAIMNVRNADFDWPEGADVRALRIVQVFPKSTPNSDSPRVGAGAQSLARGVLGTVPVEADGSAYFEMPSGVPVYFQALDEKGAAIQTMRSDTYVHQGELLSCLGCHEPKRQASPHARKAMPAALAREPSTIASDVSGSYPLTFPRLVQPVLDRHCVACHEREAKAPSLSGERSGGSAWSKAFSALKKFAWAKHGGNGAIRRNGGSRSVAGQVGAKGSRLYGMITDGRHHGVTLPPEDLYRVVLWLDCNSNFYGAYADTEAQCGGEAVLPRIE